MKDKAKGIENGQSNNLKEKKGFVKDKVLKDKS